MADSRMSVIRLSKGASWKPQPHEPPYLLPDPGTTWPDYSEARVVFSDTSGGELLTVDCDVMPEGIYPDVDADVVDLIPAGARFEIFLETDSTDKIRYGKVVRHEAPLANPPATDVTNQLLKFTDTFPTLGLRSNWKTVSGRTSVHSNSGLSLPNSVGPNLNALFSQSAIRWDTPLSGNSAKVHVTVIDPSPVGFLAKCAVILCADQRFTTFLAAVFESSTGTNHLRLVTGSGPFTWTDRVTPVTHDVTNGNDYTIVYDDLTKKLFIYQGEDLTPLLSWTDSLGVVPHGPGYAYLGMAFQASLTPLTPGVGITGWQAQDGI